MIAKGKAAALVVAGVAFAAVAAASHAESGRVLRVPITSENECLVAVVANGQSIRGLLDTGSDRVYVSRKAAKLLGFERLTFNERVWTGNGDTRTASVTLPDLSIGGLVVRNVEAMVNRGDQGEDLILGMAFLKRFGRFEVADGNCSLVW
jgi:aspartyl protease family protein